MEHTIIFILIFCLIVSVAIGGISSTFYRDENEILHVVVKRQNKEIEELKTEIEKFYGIGTAQAGVFSNSSLFPTNDYPKNDKK